MFCIDIDECAVDMGGCEHMCYNTNGSHHCQCHGGFLLAEDGKHCTGAVCNMSTNYQSCEFTYDTIHHQIWMNVLRRKMIVNKVASTHQGPLHVLVWRDIC